MSEEVIVVEALNVNDGDQSCDSQLAPQQELERTEISSESDGAETVGSSESEATHFEDSEIKPLVQSLLFAYGDPLSSKRIAEIARVDETVVDGLLLELMEESKSEDSGIELMRIAEKYQYRSKARFANAIRELKAGKPKRLSGAALETLAVIAYRQPVVKSDIEKIRGVDVSPTLKTLLERSFIKIVGHQSTVGQPALYGTTDEFLKIFGLNSLSELPTLRDVTEFGFEPGESADDEVVEDLAAAS